MSKKAMGTRKQDGGPGDRAAIPKAVRLDVLTLCRRRCCMCFGLDGSLDVKEGQLAHLDQDRSNPQIDNLAFLCQICHTQYDKSSNRILGFTPDEVRHYRDLLYDKLAHDRIEWRLTVRVHRAHYDKARTLIDQAKAVLLGISRDVTVSEGPADLK